MFHRLLLTFIFSISLFSVPSYSADEPTAKHIDAARRMISSAKFTDRFDAILPDASVSLKNQLTNTQPDKSVEIDLIVDEEALLLAVRRGSLEVEAIKLITQTYSIKELDEMTEFFSSTAGQKYLTMMPVVFQDLDKAARIWSAGIRRDLQQSVITRINELNN